MANAYDSWVPTNYVEMPVDYMQAALLINEKRAEEGLAQVGKRLQEYGSISPVSANPQALYDKTVSTLRTAVDELASKENLSTPQAQRKVNALLNDPTVLENFVNIQQDAIYAQQRRKELEEYRKKNPDVNAWRHIQAFDGLAEETGDASQFNPNRFRDLPGLADYYDVNKSIEEGIGRLKEDEMAQKKIFGNRYVEIKESGLMPEKIRQYVVSQMVNNPQVRAQLQRNLEYQYYLSDRKDPMGAGVQKLAATYKEGLLGQYQAEAARIEAELAGKTRKEIESDTKLQKKLVTLQGMKKDLEKYLTMEPEQLNQTMFAEAFKRGFDMLGNRKYYEGETYTPLAIAEFNWAMRKKLQDEKMAKINEMLNPAPLTVYDTRNQEPIADPEIKGTLEKAGLTNTARITDKHGLVTPAALDQGSYITYVPSSGNLKGKTVYVPKENAVVLEPGQKPPAGYVESGTVSYLSGGSSSAVGGLSPMSSTTTVKKVYTKPGSVSYADPKTDKKLLEKSKAEITAYLRNNGASPEQYNNLSTEADLRAAVRDISNYQNRMQSAYFPMYEIKASHTDEMRHSVAAAIPVSRVTDSNGEEVSGSRKQELEKYLLDKDKKVVLHFQPKAWNNEQSVYSFSFEGQTYKIPMHVEFNNGLAVPREIMTRVMKNQTRPTTWGNDLLVGDMVPGGNARGIAISGGATPQYQAAAAQQFNSNVSALVAAGMTKENAIETLNAKYDEGIAHIERTGEQYPMKVGNKTVYILPVKSRDGMFYSEAAVLKGQGPVTDFGGYIKANIREFANPSKNQHMVMPLSDDLKNSKMFDILTSGDDDGFDFNFNDE